MSPKAVANCLMSVQQKKDETFDGRFTIKFKRILCDNIALNDNDSVLDVACGNGSLLYELSKAKSISGYGVDVSDEMIKAATLKYPSMVFQVAGCEKLPFDDGSMDIITVSAAYHHFPDVDSFAGEAERVLKPGGVLYIADVHLHWLLRFIANPFVPLSRAGDVRFYSPDEIVQTFTKKSFEPVGVKEEGRIQLVMLRRV